MKRFAPKTTLPQPKKGRKGLDIPNLADDDVKENDIAANTTAATTAIRQDRVQPFRITLRDGEEPFGPKVL